MLSCADVIGQVTEIIQCVADGGGGEGYRRLCNHILGKNWRASAIGFIHCIITNIPNPSLLYCIAITWIFFSYFKNSGDRYCGGRLERPSGSIKTPNWPDRDYPAGVTCVWHIVAPKNQVRFPKNMKKACMCELPRWCERPISQELSMQGDEGPAGRRYLHTKTQIKIAFALFDLQKLCI